MAASALAERAACAAMYWAKPERRDADAIRGAVAGLSEADHTAVVALLQGKEIPALSDDELLARMLELGSKARQTERKIVRGGEVKTVAMADAGPVTGAGSFTGYLAGIGNRDHGGDTIQPGAMDASAAALNSGAIAWCLTDAHSDLASDVVATVTAAAVDSRGLRIQGQWMPTERAQALRRMVRNGARLGLSIDYLTDASRPDGKGGRLLDLITVVGGAITPKPLNPMAVITEGKGGGSWAPVVGLYDSIQAERRDPDRDRIRREDAMLAGLDWPPRGLSRDIRLQLLNGAAAAKAARAAGENDGDRRERERWEAANTYSSNLAGWLAEHRAR